MKATDEQVGGSHYKDMVFQPVELFAKTHCTAFQANIWKYISRYKYKNGEQDIEKCIHYAQLAIELKCNGQLGARKISIIKAFCAANKLQERQTRIIMAASFDDYAAVIKECKAILRKEYGRKD
nr:MAG TPA: nucelotide kinase [Caudoviricetes sp.]